MPAGFPMRGPLPWPNAPKGSAQGKRRRKPRSSAAAWSASARGRRGEACPGGAAQEVPATAAGPQAMPGALPLTGYGPGPNRKPGAWAVVPPQPGRRPASWPERLPGSPRCLFPGNRRSERRIPGTRSPGGCSPPGSCTRRCRSIYSCSAWLFPLCAFLPARLYTPGRALSTALQQREGGRPCPLPPAGQRNPPPS